VKYIARIFQEFIQLSNQSLGIKRALIYTTMPLKEKQIDELIASLEKTERVTLEPEVIVDPTLIGGIKIEIEGKLFDGSIRHKLNALRDQLLKRGKL
jgi:F-type H+-transporting ATPase subunit delta